MKHSMLTFTFKNKKIFRMIVSFIIIDMVDSFVGFNKSIKLFFSNKSMFSNTPTGTSIGMVRLIKFYIPINSNSSTSSPPVRFFHKIPPIGKLAKSTMKCCRTRFRAIFTITSFNTRWDYIKYFITYFANTFYFRGVCKFIVFVRGFQSTITRAIFAVALFKSRGFYVERFFTKFAINY